MTIRQGYLRGGVGFEGVAIRPQMAQRHPAPLHVKTHVVDRDAMLHEVACVCVGFAGIAPPVARLNVWNISGGNCHRGQRCER